MDERGEDRERERERVCVCVCERERASTILQKIRVTVELISRVGYGIEVLTEECPVS